MKEIMVKETNFSNSQIKKVKHLISDYGFDGGYLYYQVTDKNYNAVKKILGKAVLK